MYRSGKSSLITALFRIEELLQGSIMLDGIDIRSMPIKELRRQLCLIPQEPLMFNGTIRFNIDPIGEFSDDEIWRALLAVDLLEFINDLPGRLDQPVSDGGENFSLGQRQVRYMLLFLDNSISLTLLGVYS